ncbi:MAG: hypothetical protein JNG83_04220 [Opitutaceae bacterium]|nr:hypothetical protein [Opitutaceae bacterium]
MTGTGKASDECGAAAAGATGLHLGAPVGAFLLVALAQLLLVAGAGTDIPFYDQWNVEGQWLYPRWREGQLTPLDLLAAHNEHRIFWTHLLNLGLFAANGQWDPLVQQASGALLHGLVAGLLAWLMGREWGAMGRWLTAAGVALAFLPLAGWHNALWGFQSQVYFVLLFALLAIGGWDGGRTRSRLVGLAAAGAALLAMGAGALVPLAWLAGRAMQVVDRRRLKQSDVNRALIALAVLGVAWALRVRVPEHEALEAAAWTQVVQAAVRMLAWPHVDQPAAALVLNLPLLILVVGRLTGRRRPAHVENFVLQVGIWAALVALAAAWMRGSGPEFVAGVPSRYADFLLLLPIANAWAAVQLIREAAARRRLVASLGAAWGVFLLVGWIGLSAQMWRGVIGPRLRDRAAPERLAREFQLTRDPAVFAGQPRLLVPHPNLASVTAVLDDPRLAGGLPPSLQPEKPAGPLSRLVRVCFGED